MRLYEQITKLRKRPTRVVPSGHARVADRTARCVERYVNHIVRCGPDPEEMDRLLTETLRDLEDYGVASAEELRTIQADLSDRLRGLENTVPRPSRNGEDLWDRLARTTPKSHGEEDTNVQNRTAGGQIENAARDD